MHLPVVRAAVGRDDISDERTLLIRDNRGDVGRYGEMSALCCAARLSWWGDYMGEMWGDAGEV